MFKYSLVQKYNIFGSIILVKKDYSYKKYCFELYLFTKLNN